MNKIYKHGYTREDGKVFDRYVKRKNGIRESWISPESFARWRAMNREAAKRKRLSNLVGHTLRLKKWRSENKKHVLAYKRHRNAMKRASSVGFDKRYVEGFYAMSVRLSKCTGIRWEVDHVIPLIAGGPHHESNLQVITMKKNRSKYDR